jgi:hypothetical protein
MKFTILILSFALLFSKGTMAQSLFKPLPKEGKSTRFIRATVVPDSTWTGFRFIASLAAYSEPDNYLMTGFGIGWQHNTFKISTQKWYTDYSINGMLWGAGSVTPGPTNPAIATGITVGFFNNLFLIGPDYNFTTKKVGATLTIGISLNN